MASLTIFVIFFLLNNCLVKAFLSHSPSLVITTSLLSSSHQKKLLLLHEKLSKPNEEFQLEDNDRMSNNDSKKVLVGSKEYLNGFISTPITEQRDGDGLEQTLKLGGGVTVGLVVLLLGFMASNGLL